MVWTELTTLSLTRTWRFTPPSNAVWFRFTQNIAPYDLRFQVCQQDADSTLLEPDLVLSGFDKRLLYLPIPPVLATPRKLGLRIQNKAPIIPNWKVLIEVSDATMPLANPSNVNVNMPTASAAAATAVPAATSSTSLLAANSSRKGATIWNNSTAVLYVELGSTASATAYTAKLESGGYYEVPYSYTGAISGIWSAANGNALVRELT